MNPIRNGRFTSSEIYKLMGAPIPKKTYIQEKNYERLLGRRLNSEASARPTLWGKFVEQRAFDLLDTVYKICSDVTISHPDINFWAGSPDLIKHVTHQSVVDIKCPFTLKSFCELVAIADSETLKKVKPEYYWQLVSNAILTNSNHAELIVYCPYKSELDEIREMTQNYDGDQNKIAWINWASDDELPYIVDGGYYKNINVLSFEVSQSDKDALTVEVIESGKKLITVNQEIETII